MEKTKKNSGHAMMNLLKMSEDEIKKRPKEKFVKMPRNLCRQQPKGCNGR
ncbi:MAG: hypothetical protein WCO07_01020 [bacterium]